MTPGHEPKWPLRALRRHYRSGSSSLDRDFFAPCMLQAVRYDRAVGYFTSNALAAWAAAVPAMVARKTTTVRPIIGPILLQSDREILAKLADPGERATFEQELADRTLDGAVDRLRAGSSQARGEVFGHLIATGRLRLKFAFPTHVADPEEYHEKFGIFHMDDETAVAFTGSANETAGGHRRNFEQIDVYRSWVSEDADRVADKEKLFDDTWDGNAEGLEIQEPSAETLSRVASLAPRAPTSGSGQQQPDKWRHQAEAAAAFLATPDLRGVLEMATGTGKTRTSLRIAKTLIDRELIAGLIVTTSGNDLLDQWYKEILGWTGATSASVYRHYGSHHDIASFTLVPLQAVLVCSRQALPQLMRGLRSEDKSRLMVIHDEVHGFGSPAMRDSLPGSHQGFAAVLGLSATPEREYDQDGNQFIESEIGLVIYEFPVEKAIERGILCPFNYIPIEYSLTNGDRQRLRNVHAASAAAAASGRPWSDEEKYRRLAMVYKTAEEKPAKFRSLMNERSDLLRATILFAATREYANEFLGTIGRHTTAYSTYFEDDTPDRLEELSQGMLNCLMCCRRLSEGVDVRHLKHVILISSDKGRLQTIQRIGRSLRTDPTDPNKIATVVDFVLDPARDNHADSSRRRWLEDLSRARPNEWSE